LQVYGQGSGLDCRRHVQKLNLLQGEAEEAIAFSTYIIKKAKNENPVFCHFQYSPVLQERKTEVSRWSKYLDKESEDQEDEEEVAGTERQQFCSRRKNSVKERRKQQESFLASDVQEYGEEHGVFQLAYQAKKHKTCLVAVPDQDDRDALSGDSTVPAVCESIVPPSVSPSREITQTPIPCTKPSKWEKFLSCSDSHSKNAALVTLSLQEGSGKLGLPNTTAATAGAAGKCLEQAGRILPPGRGFVFKKHVVSTDQLASKLPGTTVPSTSCSVVEGVLFKEPQSQLPRVGPGVSETAAGRCGLDGHRRADTLVDCNTTPKPSSISHEHLFCTGEEFDDDL
ncbi:MRNIP protein, partial [Geococcyx californianus]|nr:MRNIP protein [Geococcyx californianus]